MSQFIRSTASTVRGQRGRRFSAYFFTVSLEYASVPDVVAAFEKFTSVVDYVIATHDRDTSAPHLQGAFTCPRSRLTQHEAELRFVELELPPGVLRVRPLVRGNGLGRQPFVGYSHYLSHADPLQQSRGKAFYPRETITTNVPDLWERVDSWLEVRERARRVPAPLSAPDTVAAMLAHGLVAMEIVRQCVPGLYREHRTRFERENLVVRDIPRPESDRHRLLQPLADDLLAEAEIRRLEREERLRAEFEAQERREREALLEKEQALLEETERQRLLQDEAEQRRTELAELKKTEAYRAEQELEREEFSNYVLVVAQSLDLREKGRAREAVVRERIAVDLAIEPEAVDAAAVIRWRRDWDDMEHYSDSAIREEIKLDLRDLLELPRKIALAEVHAVDEDAEAFKRALRSRQDAANYSDVLNVPPPRSEFSLKQRTKLEAASR